jgi:hypothetical protein
MGATHSSGYSATRRAMRPKNLVNVRLWAHPKEKMSS